MKTMVGREGGGGGGRDRESHQMLLGGDHFSEVTFKGGIG